MIDTEGCSSSHYSRRNTLFGGQKRPRIALGSHSRAACIFGLGLTSGFVPIRGSQGKTATMRLFRGCQCGGQPASARPESCKRGLGAGTARAEPLQAPADSHSPDTSGTSDPHAEEVPAADSPSVVAHGEQGSGGQVSRHMPRLSAAMSRISDEGKGAQRCSRLCIGVTDEIPKPSLCCRCTGSKYRG